MLARQVLYGLGHTASSFCVSYFLEIVSSFCQDPP
jgi:hypothetical protein